MPPPVNQPEQVVEIVVTGSLSLPEIAAAALTGKPITLTLEAPTVVGYSALVGAAATSRGPRPSQRQGKSHVRIQIEATNVTIAEDTSTPAPPSPPEP